MAVDRNMLLTALSGLLGGYGRGQSAGQSADFARQKALADQEKQAALEAYQQGQVRNGAGRVLTAQDANDIREKLGLGNIGVRQQAVDQAGANQYNNTLFKATKAVGDGTFNPDSANLLLSMLHGRGGAPTPPVQPVQQGQGPIVPPAGDPLGRTLPASALLGGAGTPAAPVNPFAGMGMGPMAVSKQNGIEARANLADTMRQFTEGPRTENVDAQTKYLTGVKTDFTKSETNLNNTLAGTRKGELQLKFQTEKDRNAYNSRLLQLKAQGMTLQQAQFQANQEYRNRMAGVAEGNLNARRWQLHHPAAAAKSVNVPALIGSEVHAKAAAQARLNQARVDYKKDNLSDGQFRAIFQTENANIQQSDHNVRAYHNGVDPVTGRPLAGGGLAAPRPAPPRHPKTGQFVPHAKTGRTKSGTVFHIVP